MTEVKYHCTRKKVPLYKKSLCTIMKDMDRLEKKKACMAKHGYHQSLIKLSFDTMDTYTCLILRLRYISNVFFVGSDDVFHAISSNLRKVHLTFQTHGSCETKASEEPKDTEELLICSKR